MPQELRNRKSFVGSSMGTGRGTDGWGITGKNSIKLPDPYPRHGFGKGPELREMGFDYLGAEPRPQRPDD